MSNVAAIDNQYSKTYSPADPFPDGEENTIILCETHPGTYWIDPRDLDLNTMSFLVGDTEHPAIWSDHPDGPIVAFADGRVFAISTKCPPSTLRALLTADGGESVARAELISRGILTALSSDS